MLIAFDRQQVRKAQKQKTGKSMSSLKDKVSAARKSIADKNASYERAYKFKVGKTHLRFLPGVQDPEDFSKEYGAHYLKDTRTGNIVAVVGDAEICYGKPCPVRSAIGEVIQRANERGDDVTAKAAKDWLAKGVYVLNAQVVGGVDEENKGKVVRPEFSSKSYDAIMSCLEDIMDQTPDFDIRNGFIITVERTGTGQNDTRYTFTPHLKQPDKAPSSEALAGRIDLQSYVDGKFGASVNKALNVLSTMLGKDVTTTAVGAALASSANKPALSGPAPSDDDDSDLMSLDTNGGSKVTDADYDDILPDAELAAIPETKSAPKKIEQNNIEDILRDLDDL